MTADMIIWIAVALLALISLTALIKAVRLNSKLDDRLQDFNARIDKLDNEVSAILDGNFGMGNRIKELQRDLRDTREKQQQLEQRDLGALPYNQAVRMVAGGADADQLVNQCGLSRSEADLIMLLHKSSPPVVEPLQDGQSQDIDQEALQAEAQEGAQASIQESVSVNSDLDTYMDTSPAPGIDFHSGDNSDQSIEADGLVTDGDSLDATDESETEKDLGSSIERASAPDREG